MRDDVDETLMLRLSFPGEKPTTATAMVRAWSMFDRVKRTVIGLVLTWLAAGVAIFFPILHWVLVPGLLLAGPVVAIFRFTEQKQLMSMKGSCPRCKVDRDFPLGGLRFNGPRTFTCDGCGNLIELQQA
jgi:hypothetical protein